MLAGAGIIGGLAAAAVISGPVGWVALGVVGGILGLIAGITIVWAIIEGKKEADVRRIPRVSCHIVRLNLEAC